jgi:hypothetical protein
MGLPVAQLVVYVYKPLPPGVYPIAVDKYININTSWRIAGSIPDGVIGIFHFFSSSRTMALGLTQPLAEISTRNISRGVKVAGA